MKYCIVSFIQCYAIATLNIGCINDTSEYNFIDIEKFIIAAKNGEINLDSSRYELSNMLYLDTSVYYFADSIISHHGFAKEIFLDNLSSYSENKRDKYSIRLVKPANSVRDIIKYPDKNLKRFLKEKFGISFEKEIFNKVLLYKEKAFILFIFERGQYAFTVERLNENEVKVLIAYLLNE